MKKRGISLIVLIVTIIVIIILAAVVILTLSKNNPIESAREAVFKEDVRTFQDELAMTVSKQYTNAGGHRDEKITASSYGNIKKYVPSFSKKYEGKFVIKNDELMYKEGKVVGKELEWCQSFNIKMNPREKTGAEKSAELPSEYYGKKVNYTAPNGVNDWKIFYSDGKGIYLITSEYVDPAEENQLPTKGTDAARPDQANGTHYPKAARINNDVLSEYNGSSDITDEKMKALNSDYFEKEYTSGNGNMRAVAYMLDKEIWSKLYVDSSVAEYAVGGPTVELLMKSYCITHPDKKDLYKTQASSATGYQASNDGGINWTNYISGMLSTSDTLYVLPLSSGATAMWLASPSYNSDGCMMYVEHNGNVWSYYTWHNSLGFRPLVYLNSDITLKWNDTTQKYDIE